LLIGNYSPLLRRASAAGAAVVTFIVHVSLPKMSHSTMTNEQ
jgi:hypothetical protein